VEGFARVSALVVLALLRRRDRSALQDAAEVAWRSLAQGGSGMKLVEVDIVEHWNALSGVKDFLEQLILPLVEILQCRPAPEEIDSRGLGDFRRPQGGLGV